MNQTTLQERIIQSIPSAAEQIQKFETGQFGYVLPRNESRLFPIHVFIGTDMTRTAVDTWFNWTADTILKCTEPFFFDMHDMRNSEVHYSVYAFRKIADLRKLRPEQRGFSAVVFQKNESLFATLIRNVVNTRPSKRPLLVFFGYDEAMSWLCSMMRKADAQAKEGPDSGSGWRPRK